MNLSIVSIKTKLSWYTIGCALLLCFHISSLAISSLTKFPNVDELAHLPSGISHWKFERFDLYRVNPPLVRLVGGLAGWIAGDEYSWKLYSSRAGRRTEFNIGIDSLEKEGVSHIRRFYFPRLFTLIFPIIGCISLTVWFSISISRFAGFAVCLLWCTNPDILAHGYTLCPDVGGVVGMVLSCIACHYFLIHPAFNNAILLGIALGLALSTKLTMLSLVFTLPFVCIVYFAFTHHASIRIYNIVSLMAMSVIVSFATLNTCYLFEGFGTKLGDYQFVSNLLGGESNGVQSLKNRFSGTFLSELPVPLPSNYVYGIDWLKMEVEQRRWSFLIGEWRFGSWWYYYFCTTFFKTPEVLLLGCPIGLAILAYGLHSRIYSSREILPSILLGVSAIPIFISVSLQGGFNHHHRYVIAIYPFLFSLVASIFHPNFILNCASHLSAGSVLRFFYVIIFSLFLPFLCFIPLTTIRPHYISYFNSFAGGPSNGWRLLGFSNIDWGQDILEVDKWLKENPDKRPLVMDIDYFGMNGDLFNVPTSDPPQLPKGATVNDVRKTITESQWWIISVKKLYNLPGHEGLEYLQHIEPVDKIAYCYHVYRIDPLPATPLSN